MDMILDEEPKKFKNTLIFPAALDPDAVKIVRRLKRFGHTAYLVGGCVRDLLLGSIPKDFDIATSARPRQIRRVFKNAKVIGRRFKLAHIMFRDKIIEVSTFRKPPESGSHFFKSDGLLILRDNVYGDERDDALRRDFTVNALFFDVDEEEVIDYSGGVNDVERRVLHTIGDPMIRFQEDPVRILRALRFSSRLNLNILPSSLEAMKTYAGELSKSAAQRVTEEILKLMSCGASQKALSVMMDVGAFHVLLPELDDVLDEEAAFFSLPITGRELLLQLAGTMDSTDKGKRRFGNSLFFAILFGALGGKAVHDVREAGGPYRDPGAILTETLRPIAVRMGISRFDLSHLKQILIAFQKMNAPRKKRRFKTRAFVLRDYFPDALELYRQVILCAGGELDRYQWWKNQLDEAMKDRKSSSRSKRPVRRRNRRSRRRGGKKTSEHNQTRPQQPGQS